MPKSGQLFLIQEGTTVLVMAKLATWMLEHFLVVARAACRGMSCSNVVCPDEWKEYNFRTKKFWKANKKWWLDTCTDQIHKIQGNVAGEENPNRQEEVDWERKNCGYEFN